MRWTDTGAAVREAASFISEMGVVRSASSFEDYIVGATAELDRFGARVRAGSDAARAQLLKSAGNDVEGPEDAIPLLRALVERLDMIAGLTGAALTLAEFFQTARNCVVHRSGRASPRLAEIAGSPALADALRTWPRGWASGTSRCPT